MGSMNPIFVDLSSDEESDSKVDDLKWLSEVLEAVGGKSNSFDEVEFVSEVKGDSKTKHRIQKSKSSNPTVDDEDEDDDDCVVLDGDPDKTSASATATTTVDDDDNAAESDEVLVVGQKGEIACRDFPHPRHSCAKYPFNSTLHEKYCDMCHCYVCDTRAPCPYWCVGVSSIDHCHANDKEDIWKSQREYFRTGKMPSPPVSKPPPTRAPSTMARVHSRTPTPSIIRLSRNSLPRSQVRMRACSSSTMITGFPNVRSSCQIGQSRPVLQLHGLQHRSVPLLSGVRNDAIHKKRSLYVGHLRPRVASSSHISETPQSSGGGFLSNIPDYAPLTDNSNVGGYCNTSQGLQYSHSSPLLAAADGWRDVPSPVSLETYTQIGNLTHEVPSYFSAGPASRAQLSTRPPGQNPIDSGSHRNQTSADVLAPVETPHPVVRSPCNQTQPQQLEPDNNTVQSKILSEFEEWLMDNASAGVCPSSEQVGPDDGALTFDFETLLNNN